MTFTNDMISWLILSFKYPQIPGPLVFCFGTLVIISIAIYGKYRCKYINSHTDILAGGIFKKSSKLDIDGWSVTHFAFHFILAVMDSGIFLFAIIGGILWELFEGYVGLYKPKIIMNIGFCKNKDDKYKVWWYGKYSDIVMNTLGFVSGVMVTKLLC